MRRRLKTSSRDDVVTEKSVDPDLPAPLQRSNPFENAICCQLTQHRFGLTRKVTDAEATVDGEPVDAEQVRMTKRLLRSEEYNAVAQLDGEIRRTLRQLSVPSILRQALVLIPIPLFDRAVAAIEEYQANREVAVDAFIASYGRAVDEAERDLGALFRREEYPDKEDVRAAFGVEVMYVDFSISENLKRANAAIYQREKKRLEGVMAEASEAITATMRVALSELLGKLTEKLSGKSESGKPLAFKDSTVTNLTEWLSLFDARNLASDSQLADLVSKCRKVIGTASADDLRDDVSFRDVAAKRLQEVKAEVDTLVAQVRPSRKVNVRGKSAPAESSD